MEESKIKELAIQSIRVQSESIGHLTNSIDDSFIKAIYLLKNCKGRVIVSGIGKSAYIAGKIAASLNSTGTPAIFLHAAEAIHGDLGMVQEDDISLVISKSGNTPEIKALIPLLRNLHCEVIAITGNADSYLAKMSQCTINTFVEQEVCINDLAPTTSTTAQLVMGDALMVCLEYLKDFTPEDFARYHPGGTLGKKLYIKVSDVVNPKIKPGVTPDESIPNVILSITENLKGMTVVLKDNVIEGVITDGDIRRMLLKTTNLADLKAQDIMGTHPKSIESSVLASEALKLMEKNDINQLIVTKEGEYIGVIHIHDILDLGI